MREEKRRGNERRDGEKRRREVNRLEDMSEERRRKRSQT